MIESPQKTAILFTADWCKSCQNVMPLFENKQNKEKFIILKESEENNKIFEGFGIRFYPTIFVFGEGEVKKYIGEQKVTKYLNKL